MKYALTVISPMLLLASQVSAADPQPFKPTEEQISAVEDRVAGSLSDPWSAEFKSMVASQDSRGRAYFCGLVNSKNRMGGYAGFTPYFIMALGLEPIRLHTPMIAGEYKLASVVATCRGYGLKLERR